jgi:hypothetical protein
MRHLDQSTIEDMRHAMLAAEPCPEARKGLVMEWHHHGLISDDDVAFWFYVWALSPA